MTAVDAGSLRPDIVSDQFPVLWCVFIHLFLSLGVEGGEVGDEEEGDEEEGDFTTLCLKKKKSFVIVKSCDGLDIKKII